MYYERKQFHPLADIFPMMGQEEFNALCEDIAVNGLLEPIVLYEDMILDGRNRYKACQAIMTVEPVFEEFDEKSDGDPLLYIISKNLHRRHLNESQRAMVAGRLANMRQGERTDLGANEPKFSQSDSAARLNVSRESVKRATKVIANATPELAQAVDTGKIAVSLAAKATELAPEQQIDLVDKVKDGKKASNALREIRQEQRMEQFKTKELPQGQYQIILADPPWQYEHHITDSRKIENQYPTMSLEEICTLDVAGICADSVVLFLWVPNPKLEEAFAVLKAWGFNYRTNAVWVKDRIGMGYYFRQRHELLLIATKGEAILPLPENRCDSVMESPRTEHSEKPALCYENIESMYPGLRKVELFARNIRDGWSSWGNELGR